MLVLTACSAPQTPKVSAAPPRKESRAAPKPAKPKEALGTVSLKIDATLDADALAKAFEARLVKGGFRTAPDTTARFFITFKLKEAMTDAPPPGREIAKVAYMVTAQDQMENVRLALHSGEAVGLGGTLDEALDAALAAVAEKVTPQLIEAMLQAVKH